jgi:hypothetical protein
MRAPLLLFLAVSSGLCFCGCMSTAQVTTNKVTKAEAIQIASQLAYDMREQDALQFLRQNGLAMDRPGAGSSFGWSLGFGLADGGTLVLHIRPKPVSSDGAWVNGRLTGADICNWHYDVVAKIRLTNAP